MSLIFGIDEAGRGSIIGPLVIVGVAINSLDEDKLKKINVKDSKLLSKTQRENLYSQILSISKDYKIIVISPSEIDDAVNKKENLNLNWLEAIKSAMIINSLNPSKVIIDCPSTNIITYKNFISEHILNIETEFQIEHKADLNYPVVSAASIIAKVTRDAEIEKIKMDIGIDIGSGYPSDPTTINFLKENYLKYAHIIRKSWMTYKRLISNESQKQLGEFG